MTRFSKKSVSKPLRAGAAKLKITPSQPVPLAGFYVRQGPFKGVRDDLYARAVVFESGGVEVAIVAVDTCVLPDGFCDDVIAHIAAAYPVVPDSIILNASHTHSGPAVYVPPGLKDLNAFWLKEHPYIEEQKRYTESLKENIVRVVSEARDRMVPVRIGYGRGTSSIGVNRRALDERGNVALGVNPQGPTDPELPVVRIDSESGKTVAVMFNLGVHGTRMRTEQLTGDWCGIASQYCEDVWGGETVALFLSGASGDVNPMYEEAAAFNARTGDAGKLAQMVGDEVIRVAESITPGSGGPVRAVRRVVTVPGKRYLGLLGYDPACEELAEETTPVPDTPIRLSMVMVGDIVFAGASGEIFSEIGKEFKAKCTFPNAVFMGLCNGYTSYILSDAEMGRGGYEWNASVVREGGHEAVIAGLLGMAAGFHSTT